jgi:hypothetical protein
MDDDTRDLDFVGRVVELHRDVDLGPDGTGVWHDQEHASTARIDDTRVHPWSMQVQMDERGGIKRHPRTTPASVELSQENVSSP